MPMTPPQRKSTHLAAATNSAVGTHFEGRDALCVKISGQATTLMDWVNDVLPGGFGPAGALSGAGPAGPPNRLRWGAFAAGDGLGGGPRPAAVLEAPFLWQDGE